MVHNGVTHAGVYGMSNQPLFLPYRMGNLDLPNRIVMAPLTRMRAQPHNRVPTALQAEYYAQRASAGLIIAEATEIVANIAGDPTQGARTWVLLTEAAEGGWGIAGTAFGREEFAALAAKSHATTSKPSSEDDTTSACPNVLGCDFFELCLSTRVTGGNLREEARAKFSLDKRQSQVPCGGIEATIGKGSAHVPYPANTQLWV